MVSVGIGGGANGPVGQMLLQRGVEVTREEERGVSGAWGWKGFVVHVLTEELDLSLHLAPQLIVIEMVVVVVVVAVIAAPDRFL